MPEPLQPQREVFSIVLLGDFNPAIFHPLWFSLNGLFADAEAKEADISVIAKELASFTIGGINIQVEKSRLGFTITEPQHEPVLQSTAIGTMMILEHTPVTVLGFNRDMIFDVESDEARNEIGFRLVPKDDWAAFLKPRGMKLLIFEGERSDCVADQIQFRVSPSGEVPHGVFVGVNQQYMLKTEVREKPELRLGEAMRAMSEDWKSFTQYAKNAVRQVIHPDANSEEC